MLVSNCRWEVGDVSTLNIGETVVSYQTMKYKFNYTPLVKFLNFIVWYDTMKTSMLERQYDCKSLRLVSSDCNPEAVRRCTALRHPEF